MTGTHSRPLTALTLVLVGWVALRAALLNWPAPVTPVRPMAHTTPTRLNRLVAAEPPAVRVVLPPPLSASSRPKFAPRVPVVRSGQPQPIAVLTQVTVPPPSVAPTVNAQPAPPRPRATPASLAIAKRTLPARLTASFWLLQRFESGTVQTLGERALGGSQAGVRLFYGPPQGLALTGRVSSALRAPGKEASLGLGLRAPNLALLVERRVALDRGGRDAFAATAVAGFDAVALPARLRFDGYAQAGIVGLRRRDLFAEAEAALERPLSPRLGLGAFIRAGAQPRVRRVDIGPQLVLRLPLADRGLRLAAQYSRRVAGNAAPASGPVLVAGFDF